MAGPIGSSTTSWLPEVLKYLPNKGGHSLLQLFVREHEGDSVRENVSAGFLPIKECPTPKPGRLFLNSHSEILKGTSLFLKNLKLIALW